MSHSSANDHLAIARQFEGFSPIPHHLPQSTGEGGCYAETCASIAAMMTGERILSHGVNGKVRDTVELCLLNAVLGGGSLNGTAFSYANKMATWGEETAVRKDWFEGESCRLQVKDRADGFVVCCCPPNLSRTLGMLGGYTWHVVVDEEESVINLDVYLFVSATRKIVLPDGQTAKVTMRTEMPWTGKTEWEVQAPQGWTWNVQLPVPKYAKNVKVSRRPDDSALSLTRFAGIDRLDTSLEWIHDRHITRQLDLYDDIRHARPAAEPTSRHTARHPHCLPRTHHLRRRRGRQ